MWIFLGKMFEIPHGFAAKTLEIWERIVKK